MALALVFISHGAFSQVLVSDIPTATADLSAMLDVQSTSKGFLFPRMSLADRTVLSGNNPPTSMIIWQTDNTPGLYYNTGTAGVPVWVKLTDANTPAGYWTQTGSDIYYNTGNVGVGITNPTSGLHVDGTARITGALQLDNGASAGYVLTTDASGNATWQDVNTNVTNDDDWTVSGNDIYNSNSGNVGVGNSSPGADLDVTGSIWSSDSIYVTGRTASIFINGETSYEPTIRFSYEDNSEFKLHINTPATNPYLSVTSDLYEDMWRINQWGTVRHDYFGSATAGYILNSSAAHPAMMIFNDNGDATSFAYGLQVSLDNTSLTTQVGIGAFVEGDASGVYGQNTNYGSYGHVGTDSQGIYGQHGATANRGGIGSSSSGVWGEADATGHSGRLGLDGSAGSDWGVYGDDGAATDPNFGGIGTLNYGAYGQYNSEDFWGALGASNCGVLGSLGGGGQDLEDGDYAIIGEGIWEATESGGGYSGTQSIGGVKGYNGVGVAYSFGVAGYTVANNNRTGGVLGYIAFDEWGALGYLANNSTSYGVYARGGTGSGNGKSSTEPSVNIGIGTFGDLFGAHIDGNIYGLYASGNDYGIYAHGDVYRTGADVHLQMDNAGQNNVMYTLVSTEMTVQTYGVGQLINGKSNVNFDNAFAGVVSSGEPIVVTITPIGKSEGVYLEQVDGNGFSVAENNDGKSNVQFSWIAIGKRAGFENMSLPQDVIASDYNDKLQRGLSQDTDPNDQAEGLYYQNGRLYNGQVLQPRTSSDAGIQPAKKLEAFKEENKNALRKAPAEKIKDQKKTDQDIIKK